MKKLTCLILFLSAMLHQQLSGQELKSGVLFDLEAEHFPPQAATSFA